MCMPVCVHKYVWRDAERRGLVDRVPTRGGSSQKGGHFHMMEKLVGGQCHLPLSTVTDCSGVLLIYHLPLVPQEMPSPRGRILRVDCMGFLRWAWSQGLSSAAVCAGTGRPWTVCGLISWKPSFFWTLSWSLFFKLQEQFLQNLPPFIRGDFVLREAFDSFSAGLSEG